LLGCGKEIEEDEKLPKFARKIIIKKKLEPKNVA